MEPSGYCPDRTGTVVPVQTGVLSLEDGTLEVFFQDVLEVSTFSFPDACLEEGSSCADLTVLGGWQTACRRRGDLCHCEGRRPMTPPGRTAWSVRIDGDEVLLLDAPGTLEGRWPFCVEGGHARIRALWSLGPDRPAVETLLVLER